MTECQRSIILSHMLEIKNGVLYQSPDMIDLQINLCECLYELAQVINLLYLVGDVRLSSFVSSCPRLVIILLIDFRFSIMFFRETLCTDICSSTICTILSWFEANTLICRLIVRSSDCETVPNKKLSPRPINGSSYVQFSILILRLNIDNWNIVLVNFLVCFVTCPNLLLAEERAVNVQVVL